MVKKNLNQKQKNNYKMLAMTCELLLIAFERIEAENKDKRLKIAREYEKAKEDIEGLKTFSENVLNLVFQDNAVRSTTAFNDAVNRIDTIIRKTL